MNANPSVTCFCPTRNRRRWLPKAIACFQAQTYADLRMLIIADGEEVGDLIPKDDLRISLCTLRDPERPRTSGEKFNLCCELSKTEIVCKWDDDDYSAPGRVADQVQRLQESGKAVTGYHTMMFTDGRDWWKYPGPPTFAMGTSLCFRRDWWEKHRFSAMQVGSDVLFSNEAANAGQLASADAGDLMVATIHPGNNSPRRTSGGPWQKVPGFAGVPGYAWSAGA